MFDVKRNIKVYLSILKGVRKELPKYQRKALIWYFFKEMGSWLLC